MNSNELKMRSLAFAIGLEFDEVRTILSEETLSSINMTNTKGGDAGAPFSNNGGYCSYCNGIQCAGNCACASTSVSSSIKVSVSGS